jgi:endoglucanase
MLEILKTLCRVPGISGDEGEVRAVIHALAAPFANDIKEDTLGNLIVEKRGTSRTDKRIMLCAHMDETGVIVTGIDGDGYLKFAFGGSVDRRVVLGKRVYIGDNRIPGVIGAKPSHMLKDAERDTVPEAEAMYIDIGASSRADAESRVRPGDTGAFDPRVFEFGNGFIKAKAIDDRVGCAVMLKLIRDTPPVDCVFVFTVQEEVGARGAATAAYSIQPDIALILEATTAADIPGVVEGRRVCTLGGGAVSPFMDRGAIYDRGLWEDMKTIAERENIPWQTKTYISGGTDAQTIQRAAGGARVAAIALPTRNLHSPACVAKISDIQSMLLLTQAFLASLRV